MSSRYSSPLLLSLLLFNRKVMLPPQGLCACWSFLPRRLLTIIFTHLAPSPPSGLYLNATFSVGLYFTLLIHISSLPMSLPCCIFLQGIYHIYLGDRSCARRGCTLDRTPQPSRPQDLAATALSHTGKRVSHTSPAFCREPHKDCQGHYQTELKLRGDAPIFFLFCISLEIIQTGTALVEPY